MKFSEDMIGKRVREISTGDEGTVLRRRTYKCDNDPLPDYKLAVEWDDTGEDLSINVDEVEFIDTPISIQEITINGKRYKLVPIEEE